MKKIFAVLLALVMVFSVAAVVSANPNSGSGSQVVSACDRVTARINGNGNSARITIIIDGEEHVQLNRPANNQYNNYTVGYWDVAVFVRGNSIVRVRAVDNTPPPPYAGVEFFVSFRCPIEGTIHDGYGFISDWTVVNFRDEIVFPADPVRKGYRFVGWQGGHGSYRPVFDGETYAEMVGENYTVTWLTIWAQWEELFTARVLMNGQTFLYRIGLRPAVWYNRGTIVDEVFEFTASDKILRPAGYGGPVGQMVYYVEIYLGDLFPGYRPTGQSWGQNHANFRLRGNYLTVRLTGSGTVGPFMISFQP